MTKRHRWLQYKCDICGKFIKAPADSRTPYGNSTMAEPPNEEWLCEKCVAEEIEYHLKNHLLVTAYWLKPDYAYEVNEILGYHYKQISQYTWKWLPDPQPEIF